jgi:3-oxoacyl-[acyl-carrier-protein] synthase III
MALPKNEREKAQERYGIEARRAKHAADKVAALEIEIAAAKQAVKDAEARAEHARLHPALVDALVPATATSDSQADADRQGGGSLDRRPDQR